MHGSNYLLRLFRHLFYYNINLLWKKFCLSILLCNLEFNSITSWSLSTACSLSILLKFELLSFIFRLKLIFYFHFFWFCFFLLSYFFLCTNSPSTQSPYLLCLVLRPCIPNFKPNIRENEKFGKFRLTQGLIRSCIYFVVLLATSLTLIVCLRELLFVYS